MNDVNLKNRRETPPLRRLRQLKLNVFSSSSNNTTTTNTTILTTTPMKRKQENDEELEVDEDEFRPSQKEARRNSRWS